MIETKVLEIRDRMTCIPALAVMITGGPGDRRDHIVWRAGYGPDGCVLLIHLQTCESHYEPHEWNNGRGCRTMSTVHEHLQDNWAGISDGQLIDARALLCETDQPCESEFPPE